MMLSALRMPGNIEGRLAGLQAALFREQGLMSARALPPLVPLLWSRTPPELAALDPAPLPPLTVTGGAAAGNTGIVLGLSPLRPLEELAARLGEAAREASAEGDDAPFPLGAPAILLAPAAPGAAAMSAGSIHGTVIRSFTLVVIEIRVWEGEGPERVVWEEVARRRLRKQRG